jgi:hypothetical protein
MQSLLLEFDGVAPHLVIQSRSLDAEQFGGFFLISPAFGKRLKNGGALEIVESLDSAAR